MDQVSSLPIRPPTSARLSAQTSNFAVFKNTFVNRHPEATRTLRKHKEAHIYQDCVASTIIKALCPSWVRVIIWSFIQDFELELYKVLRK